MMRLLNDYGRTQKAPLMGAFLCAGEWLLSQVSDVYHHTVGYEQFTCYLIEVTVYVSGKDVTVPVPAYEVTYRGAPHWFSSYCFLVGEVVAFNEGITPTDNCYPISTWL